VSLYEEVNAATDGMLRSEGEYLLTGRDALSGGLDSTPRWGVV
jgi:hypothetical protein